MYTLFPDLSSGNMRNSIHSIEGLSASLLQSIRNALLKRQETVCVAESVTCGLLQSGFAVIPDASLFFQGGLTAYNLGQKARHLTVNPIHAEKVNCVSQIVADEMAAGARKLFSSDWSISITGYATPVPESDRQVFAFFSIAYGEKIRQRGKIVPKDQHPAGVQAYYVATVMKAFKRILEK